MTNGSEPEGDRVIAASTLGAIGRFGNQVFQYAFAALYAARHGLALETPDWIGRRLFDRRDRPLSRPLPIVLETEIDVAAALTAAAPPFVGVDLWGWFLVDTSIYAAHRERLRSLFAPAAAVAAPLVAASERLRARGGAVVGVHLRRGDFGRQDRLPLLARLWWTAPIDAYRRWLTRLWPTLDRPVLFVASDEPAAVIDELAEFAPVTSAGLGIDCDGELAAAPFYPDFYLLGECDHLAISNSTFAFAAALLARRAPRVVRPVPGSADLAAVDPWASPPFLASPVEPERSQR